MFQRHDFEEIKEYLEEIGIPRKGWSVEMPENCLFGYRNQTCDTIISTKVDDDSLKLWYRYSLITNEQPINPATGMGIYATQQISSGEINNYEELYNLLYDINPELFRSRLVDDIMD